MRTFPRAVGLGLMVWALLSLACGLLPRLGLEVPPTLPPLPPPLTCTAC